MKSCENCKRYAENKCTFRYRLKPKIKKLLSEQGYCEKWKEKKRKKVKVKNNQNLTSKLEDLSREAKELSRNEKMEGILFSPTDLVEEIISSDFDPHAFDLIDERDIPKAKNEIDFILNPEFLGIELFPRQLVVTLEFFSAYCPYCSDKNFIKKKVKVDTPIENILDRTVLYENGICPKCKKDKYQAYKSGDLNFYHQLIGVAGQRSGKSALTAILSACIIYKYLKLPNPTRYFNLLQNVNFHGTFVSLTYDNAYDLLWQPFYELITGSKWFVNYIEFLNNEGERLGKEIVKIRDTFIIFNHKKITIYPSGPDKRKLRGKTRILSSIDEIGWFFAKANDAVKLDPDEIFEALDNSMMTVRSASRRLFPTKPDTPTAYGIYISSPSSKTDKSMRLYNESLNSRVSYGFKFPTWKFNPNIKKSDLHDKFITDPVKAERDFGANPPHGIDPFISNAAPLLEVFSTKRKNAFKIKKYEIRKDSLGKNVLFPKIEIRKSHTYPSILAIDCGYSKNSFSCALLHGEFDSNSNELSKVFCSGLIEILPNPYPISFPDVYDNVIIPILKEFDVKLVAFDRWQSIDLKQRIFLDFEIDSIQYSVNYKDFELLRSKVLSSVIEFPKLENEIDELMNIKRDIKTLVDRYPVTHLFLQFLMCKDTGRTVTKGEEISDDILRAVTLGVSLLENEEYIELFIGGGAEKNNYYKNISDIVALVTSTNSMGISGQPKGSGIGVVVGSNSIGIGSSFSQRMVQK